MTKKLSQLFLALLLIVSITGCTNQSNKTKPIDNQQELPTSTEEMLQPVTSTEATDNNQSTEVESIQYMVSDVASTVFYEGSDFIQSCFALGGNRLFLVGISPEHDYFIGTMEQEASLFETLSIEIPSDMRIINIYVDNQSKCHTKWISTKKTIVNDQEFDIPTYEKTWIIVINSEGEIEKKLDISELMPAEAARSYNLCVDLRGNYYMDHDNEIIKIDAKGTQMERIICEGSVGEIGCGKSGAIYCAYYNANNEIILGRIEGQTVVDVEAVFENPNINIYCIMPGTDSELLIYDPRTGVYTYNIESNVIENRIYIENLPISGEEVRGYGFLGDGRLCIYGMQEENPIFYYIPAGK